MARKLKALILTANEFEGMEFFFPCFRFKGEGIEVHVAGPKKGEMRGEHGHGFETGIAFDEVNPDDYDILFLPSAGRIKGKNITSGDLELLCAKR